MEVRRRWPRAEVEGIDSDEEALQAAAAYAQRAALPALFQKGYLQDLPVAAERYDVVLCVLALHRLRGEDRGDTFQEFTRVLKPGGRLLLVDFGVPVEGARGELVRRLAEHEKGIADQLDLGLEELCRMGGFEEIEKLGEGAFGLQAILATRISA